MAFTRKKRQLNRRLLSQLDGFDQDITINNIADERQQNIILNEGTGDREFTVGPSGNNLMVSENAVIVKTLERCFNERIDREMSFIVDMVEDRIQNASLTAFCGIVAPKIELAIRSVNVSSGRDATNVTAISERGKNIGITASCKKASENNNVLHK